MTSQQLYNSTLALMFCEDGSEYAHMWRPFLNIMLTENYWLNNALRIAAGKAPMVTVPLITSAEEEIGYEPVMERQILPYGIAGYMLAEDEPALSASYMNKYEYERRSIGRARYAESAVCTDTISYN